MANKKKHFTKYTAAQSIFLVADFFIQNSLNNFAAACAYSFFFSIIPIAMITLAILVHVMRASPEIIAHVINHTQAYSIYFDVAAFIEKIMQGYNITLVNIFSVIFMLWMARKLFATIMQGMEKIFCHSSKQRAGTDQILIFAGEFIFAIVAVVVIITIFAFQLLFKLSFFNLLRPSIERIASALPFTIVNVVAFSLIFIFVFLVYKFGSRTKPSSLLCAVSSAVCATVFFLATRLIGIFLNVRYNMVYGVLSSIMIILLEIYVFFIIFFACAQLIYVLQFFDSLLVCELYLLPPYETTDIKESLHRILFINPDFLMAEYESISFRSCQTIFYAGDKSRDVYYVAKGSVQVKTDNKIIYYDRGDFFGERNCLLKIPRKGTATATTDCTLIKFEPDTFEKLIEKNPQTLEKAIRQFIAYN